MWLAILLGLGRPIVGAPQALEANRYRLARLTTHRHSAEETELR
jgi:hypothetical protein